MSSADNLALMNALRTADATGNKDEFRKILARMTTTGSSSGNSIDLFNLHQSAFDLPLRTPLSPQLDRAANSNDASSTSTPSTVFISQNHKPARGTPPGNTQRTPNGDGGALPPNAAAPGGQQQQLLGIIPQQSGSSDRGSSASFGPSPKLPPPPPGYQQQLHQFGRLGIIDEVNRSSALSVNSVNNNSSSLRDGPHRSGSSDGSSGKKILSMLDDDEPQPAVASAVAIAQAARDNDKNKKGSKPNSPNTQRPPVVIGAIIAEAPRRPLSPKPPQFQRSPGPDATTHLQLPGQEEAALPSSSHAPPLGASLVTNTNSSTPQCSGVSIEQRYIVATVELVQGFRRKVEGACLERGFRMDTLISHLDQHQVGNDSLCERVRPISPTEHLVHLQSPRLVMADVTEESSAKTPPQRSPVATSLPPIRGGESRQIASTPQPDAFASTFPRRNNQLAPLSNVVVPLINNFSQVPLEREEGSSSPPKASSLLPTIGESSRRSPVSSQQSSPLARAQSTVATAAASTPTPSTLKVSPRRTEYAVSTIAPSTGARSPPSVFIPQASTNSPHFPAGRLRSVRQLSLEEQQRKQRLNEQITEISLAFLAEFNKFSEVELRQFPALEGSISMVAPIIEQQPSAATAVAAVVSKPLPSTKTNKENNPLVPEAATLHGGTGGPRVVVTSHTDESSSGSAPTATPSPHLSLRGSGHQRAAALLPSSTQDAPPADLISNVTKVPSEGGVSSRPTPVESTEGSNGGIAKRDDSNTPIIDAKPLNQAMSPEEKPLVAQCPNDKDAKSADTLASEGDNLLFGELDSDDDFGDGLQPEESTTMQKVLQKIATPQNRGIDGIGDRQNSSVHSPRTHSPRGTHSPRSHSPRGHSARGATGKGEGGPLDSTASSFSTTSSSFRTTRNATEAKVGKRWVLNDKYLFETALGRGAQGSVWRCVDLTRNKPVAIKVVQRAKFQRRKSVVVMGPLAGEPMYGMSTNSYPNLDSLQQRPALTSESRDDEYDNMPEIGNRTLTPGQTLANVTGTNMSGSGKKSNAGRPPMHLNKTVNPPLLSQLHQSPKHITEQQQQPSSPPVMRLANVVSIISGSEIGGDSPTASVPGHPLRPAAQLLSLQSLLQSQEHNTSAAQHRTAADLTSHSFHVGLGGLSKYTAFHSFRNHQNNNDANANQSATTLPISEAIASLEALPQTTHNIVTRRRKTVTMLPSTTHLEESGDAHSFPSSNPFAKANNNNNVASPIKRRNRLALVSIQDPTEEDDNDVIALQQQQSSNDNNNASQPTLPTFDQVDSDAPHYEFQDDDSPDAHHIGARSHGDALVDGLREENGMGSFVADNAAVLKQAYGDNEMGTIQVNLAVEIIVGLTRHEHILPLTEVIDDPDCAYIFLVMPLVEGVPCRLLANGVVKHGPLHPRTVVRYTRGVASALELLHAANVVHCDVKIENIMKNGKDLVLGDFGLCQMGGGVEVVGGGKGTYAYWAPECHTSIRTKLTPETDCFALGVCVYVMIFGKFPYWTDDVQNPIAWERVNPGCEGKLPPIPPNALRSYKFDEDVDYEAFQVLCEITRGMMSPDVTMRWTARRVMHRCEQFEMERSWVDDKTKAMPKATASK